MTNFHPQMTLPQVVSIDGQLFFVTPNQSNFMPQRPYQLQAQLQAQQIHTQQHQPHQAQPQAQPQQIQLQLQLQQHQQLQLQQLQVPLPNREPESSLSELVDNEDLQYLQQRQQQLNGQVELEQQIPQIRPTSPVENTNDRILKKVKNIKGGQYIGHYIDSQLIIETTEPFKEKKKKKKKKLLAQNQNLDNHNEVISDNQQQQQQQQQQQNHHLQHNHQNQQQVVPYHQRDQSDALISSAVQADVAQSAGTTQNRPGSAVAVNMANSDNDVILKLREDMKSWSVADVVKFIELQDDISAYSSKFAEDEIDGTALLYMIDRNLNMQVLSTMFKNGPAMKIEATLSKFKLKE